MKEYDYYFYNYATQLEGSNTVKSIGDGIASIALPYDKSDLVDILKENIRQVNMLSPRTYIQITTLNKV
jgi:hypothetical protein